MRERHTIPLFLSPRRCDAIGTFSLSTENAARAMQCGRASSRRESSQAPRGASLAARGSLAGTGCRLSLTLRPRAAAAHAGSLCASSGADARASLPHTVHQPRGECAILVVPACTPSRSYETAGDRIDHP